MHFTNNEIATYLFCSQLSHSKTIPLTILEWNAIVKSFSEQEIQPEMLLKMTSSELLLSLTQATNSQKSNIIKKIEARQKLGLSMIELEEIIHQGYNIMFRSKMPPRLKKLTQKYLPPFFYYAGDPVLLTYRALGVVGARDANNEELKKTADISVEAVSHGVVIVSGGAKGVDTTAVEASLENGGKAIVFPADGLSKWVRNSKIRQYITNGQLLLMSTQKLNASFSGQYAMQRNKFIHAPSDAVLVASSKISGPKASGTWEGVKENIKEKWSPIYVIGQSPGVKALLNENSAKLFSSFEEIYLQGKTLHEKESNQFNRIADKLIQQGIKEGRDKEGIKKMFEKRISEYFNNETKKEKESQESLQQQKMKQLSVEDLL